jgi:hypothetical protein
MLTRERTGAEAQVASRRHSQDQLLSQLKASYEGKLAASKSEDGQHLASLKREAAMRSKRIRNQMERDIESKRADRQAALEDKRVSVSEKVAALHSKAEAAKKQREAADKKAEKIYSQNRADWKKKHESEVQANGVKGEISHLEPTLDQAKTRLAEAKKRETELRERIKEQGRQKMLMAARLKNLHSREESFQETEQKYNIENDRLKHQISEVEATRSAAALEAKKTEQAAEQSVLLATKQASEKAKKDVQTFKATTLQAAQAEISRLQDELRRRSAHESHAEQELFQQEHNVQAERKEADDALAKAKLGGVISKEQAEWELRESQTQARNLVDEARRVAAAVRERARSGGFEDGLQSAQGLLQEQMKAEDTLSEKEVEMKRLSSEFKEKMDHQISAQQHDLVAMKENERKKMHAELEEQFNSQVRRESEAQEAAIQARRKDFMSEKSRAEKEENDIKLLEKENADLRAQVESLRDQLKHEKQEMTWKLVDGVDRGQ